MLDRDHIEQAAIRWWKAGIIPSDLSGLTLWLDDPNVPSNIIESALRVSQWFDISGEGNNFPQLTGADQGLRTDQFIEYDGVSEFQDGTSVLSSFASDPSGELFIVAHELEGAGVTTDLLGGGLSSATSNFMRFSIAASDDLSLLMRVGGVSIWCLPPKSKSFGELAK